MKTTFYAILRFGLIAVVGLATVGCEKINDMIQDVSVEPVIAFTEKEKTDIKEDREIDVINLNKYMTTTDPDINKKTDKMERDGIQSEIMTRSDQKCTKFRKFLFAVHATRKLALRSLSVALSAAGGIVSGGAGQAFSAASGGFQAFDETFDAEVLQKQAITLVLQTISSTKKSLKKEIDEKRKKEPKDYSVQEAIQDALQYHNLCSLTEALAELGRAVEENEGNKEKLKLIKEKDKVQKEHIESLKEVIKKIK